MTMLYAVTVRDADDPGPGDICDIADLVIDNADDIEAIIAALRELRANIKRGDWTSVTIGGGAAAAVVLTPLHPEAVGEHIAAMLEGGAL